MEYFETGRAYCISATERSRDLAKKYAHHIQTQCGVIINGFTISGP